jgi:glycerate dehydrogenase
LTTYEHTTPEQLIERAQDSRVLLTNKTPLSRETINSLPQLEFIGVLATGFNVVDLKAAKARGIPVSNVPTYGTETVAQHTWALILELCHHVGAHSDDASKGNWTRSQSWSHWRWPLIELQGRRLGLIGRGPIAQRVAEIGRAFGMEVMHGSHSHPEGGDGLAPLGVIRRSSDVLSLHCRFTPENQGFLNAEFFREMKPGAFLINTARGALVCEADLADALNAGVLAGAAVDVLAQEPPAETNPLLKAKNCFVTAHMAWSGLTARRRLVETTEANVKAFLNGSPINVVNL